MHHRDEPHAETALSLLKTIPLSILKTSGDCWKAQVRLAALLLDLGRPKEARSLAVAAATNAQESMLPAEEAPARLQMARADLMMGKLDSAQKAIDRVKAIHLGTPCTAQVSNAMDMYQELITLRGEREAEASPLC